MHNILKCSKGLRREETAHTVVKSYYRKNSLDISYVRHHAIKANFLEIGGEWFLQITPTYRFTRDGWNPDKFGASRLKKIKEFEGNPGIFGIALMWANYLAVDSIDPFSSATHHLSFGELMQFEANRGVPDEAWHPPAKVKGADDAELDLGLMV